MSELDTLSDNDLFYRLSMEYLQALQLKDFTHIDLVIAPHFWLRFKRYYEEYKGTWKNSRSIAAPVLLVLDPGQEKRMELDWMDQVLRGEIELQL
jgi:hypothetical protein